VFVCCRCLAAQAHRLAEARRGARPDLDVALNVVMVLAVIVVDVGVGACCRCDIGDVPPDGSITMLLPVPNARGQSMKSKQIQVQPYVLSTTSVTQMGAFETQLDHCLVVGCRPPPAVCLKGADTLARLPIPSLSIKRV
jgi:hypothetical protein